MNKESWTVYEHIFPTGDIYYGITSRPPEERWNNGNGYRGQKVYELIKQYDWDTEIKHNIIAKDLSESEASILERELISYGRTNFPDKVKYNIASGGFNSHGAPKIVYQYDIDGNYIQHHISLTAAAYYLGGLKFLSSLSSCCNQRESHNTCGGYRWSYQYKDSLPPLTDNTYGISVDQFDLNGLFIKQYKTIIDAEKAFNAVGKSHIYDCCQGNRRISLGYQWRYHQEQPHCDAIRRKTSARIIDQYDIKGNYIKTWIGLEDLQQFLKTNNKPNHILDVCNGKRNIAYGYIWKFNPSDKQVRYNYNMPVIKLDKNNNFLNEYDNIYMAAQLNPGTRKDHIYECCIGKSKTHCGFQWNFK